MPFPAPTALKPSPRLAILAAMCLLCGTGCGVLGTHVSCFCTPEYLIPTGYSETYREHLERTDPRPMRKVLLDPALADLKSDVPPRMTPIPDLPATRPPDGGAAPDSAVPNGNRRDLMRTPFDPNKEKSGGSSSGSKQNRSGSGF